MKLRSTEPRNLQSGAAKVAVDELSRPYDLSFFESGSVFSEHVEGLEIASSDWPVGVNLDALSLAELWASASSVGVDRMSYWVNAIGAGGFATVVQSLDDLAIDGITPMGEWVVFDLTEATTTDSSPEAFLSGFLTSRQLMRPASRTATPVMRDEPRNRGRAALLTELVHIAKPLKPYLPPSVIHAGYKVLGALK